MARRHRCAKCGHMNPSDYVGCEVCDAKKPPKTYTPTTEKHTKHEATPQARHCMQVIADLLAKQPRIVHFRERLGGPLIAAEVTGWGMDVEVHRIEREPGEDDDQP